MPDVPDKIPQPTTNPTNILGKQIRLADGRQLGYTEYGDPQGKPIFHSHGWVSSRLEFGHNHHIEKPWAHGSSALIGQELAFRTSNRAEEYWIGPTISPNWPTLWA